MPKFARRIDTGQKKINDIATHFAGIMRLLGLDPTTPGLIDTPKRVARMLYNETCLGLHTEPPKVTTFPNQHGKQMIVVRDIKVRSLCEHHFLPVIGVAHIGYMPEKKLAGLSKFNRVVAYFAGKPQLQERLMKDICAYLVEQLQTQDIMVVIKAKHFCTCARGVKDDNSETVTSHVSGKFFEQTVRDEFFKLLQL